MLSIAEAQQLPTVLVLASGRGERFTASGGTGHKLQADLCGKTVLQRTLDAVRATRDAAGWLILPADLPLISPQTLVDLAQLKTTAQVVVPLFEGQRGHPVRFASVCGDALASLHGSQGGAAIKDQFESLCWPVLDAGCVTDIDSLDDLLRARGLLLG